MSIVRTSSVSYFQAKILENHRRSLASIASNGSFGFLLKVAKSATYPQLLKLNLSKNEIRVLKDEVAVSEGGEFECKGILYKFNGFGLIDRVA